MWRPRSAGASPTSVALGRRARLNTRRFQAHLRASRVMGFVSHRPGICEIFCQLLLLAQEMSASTGFLSGKTTGMCKASLPPPPGERIRAPSTRLHFRRQAYGLFARKPACLCLRYSRLSLARNHLLALPRRGRGISGTLFHLAQLRLPICKTRGILLFMLLRCCEDETK